jgi:prevent-host-death family protein
MRTELVTTLKRQATEILNQLEKDREPILITQHGVPSAYLVDVETFETLQRRMTLLALHDLDAIADYIALDNPEAAWTYRYSMTYQQFSRTRSTSRSHDAF